MHELAAQGLFGPVPQQRLVVNLRHFREVVDETRNGRCALALRRDLQSVAGATVQFRQLPVQNKAKTGGIAFKFGLGQQPSYVVDGTGFEGASQTLWVNAPLTLPFLSNILSWDIMLGASVTRNYGDDEATVGAFTYSTRLAWYPKSPKLAVVGEVYGAEGAAKLTPEYGAGLRWEPTTWANIAFTYGGTFNGMQGSGFEIGVMLFSPPFACFGPCR